MRRADARSAQIRGPDGIAQSFQVCTYSGEPFASKFARNLFAKRDCSFAEGDKIPEDGPEMARVGFARLPARATEGLAGTGAGPNRSGVWPAGQAQGETPPSDSGEEMLLCESGDFMGFNI